MVRSRRVVTLFSEAEFSALQAFIAQHNRTRGMGENIKSNDCSISEVIRGMVQDAIDDNRMPSSALASTNSQSITSRVDALERRVSALESKGPKVTITSEESQSCFLVGMGGKTHTLDKEDFFRSELELASMVKGALKGEANTIEDLDSAREVYYLPQLPLRKFLASQGKDPSDQIKRFAQAGMLITDPGKLTITKRRSGRDRNEIALIVPKAGVK